MMTYLTVTRVVDRRTSEHVEREIKYTKPAARKQRCNRVYNAPSSL